MISTTQKQLFFMLLIAVAFVGVYFIPFQEYPLAVSGLFGLLFPVQALIWRLTYGRKLKDYLFSLSLLIALMILKHYWGYSDLLFYLISIILAAVLHYRTFLGVAATALGIEIFREFTFQYERPEEVLFRYTLFFIAGTLTAFLLREEKRLKDEFKRELDDLKYGIHQVDKEPISQISDSGQISRKVDAALALDESLQKILQLLHGIFKPDTSLIWQYLPQKNQLRVRDHCSIVPELKIDTAVNMGEGPIGWTALNQKFYFQQERDEGIPATHYKKNHPVRSLLAVPILDGDRLEGVLSVDSAHLKFFADDAVAAMESFAAQISETIRMARLAKEREERAFEFQAFYHASKELSSVIDFEETVQRLNLLSGEIVKSDFTAVAVTQSDSAKYKVYEWNNGNEAPVTHADLENDGSTWISWFLQSIEEPLIIPSSQLQLQEMPVLRSGEDMDEFVTYLAVPMRHQQAVIGALLFASKHKDAFSSHQARVLSILGNQAAVSLENSAIINKMEQLAITDGLTTLFNHRYFQEALDREIERASRLNENLTLMLMDIDHFKGFNDSFGHPVGDFILRSLALLLKKGARKIDILARYGGEEFAALLPGIDVKNARKTAERWRKAVQRASFKRENKSFAVTISIGFATYPTDVENKVELIERADRALYDAKENGRNQARHCNDSENSRSSLFG
jgi:diguanylate cyclase (GGDEF)-like protein